MATRTQLARLCTWPAQPTGPRLPDSSVASLSLPPGEPEREEREPEREPEREEREPELERERDPDPESLCDGWYSSSEEGLPRPPFFLSPCRSRALLPGVSRGLHFLAAAMKSPDLIGLFLTRLVVVFLADLDVVLGRVADFPFPL